MSIISEDIIKKMFEVGAHLGYSRRRRHSSVKPHIFGTKNNVEIINLESTQTQLEVAKEFMRSLGKTGKRILFVGNKNEIRSVVGGMALAMNMPFVTERWLGGTLTNFEQMRKRANRLRELEEQKTNGELAAKYTKREQGVLSREMDNLRRHFGGVVSMTELPAALFVIDSRQEKTALSEAALLRIPVISVSNSDCDISSIEYPIVANDSSIPSISFFLDELRGAYEEGSRDRVSAPVQKEVVEK